jgi:hypothetical protein
MSQDIEVQYDRRIGNDPSPGAVILEKLTATQPVMQHSLESMRKTTRNLRLTGIPAKIRTGCLQNTCQMN